MKLYGFAAVGVGGGEFVGEIAEMITFIIAGDLCRPFPLSFVPMDAFVFRGFVATASQVAAIPHSFR